ncbi:hypothetical protein D3C86_1744790 [compost metagenome]
MLDKMAFEASAKIQPMIAAVRLGKMPQSIVRGAADSFSAMMYREVVLHFLAQASADPNAPHVLVVGQGKGATS